MERNYTFGVALPQGWRSLDDNRDTAFQQYQFSKNIAELADRLGYSSAYAYDHMWGGSFCPQNRDKNFFECLVLLTSIITNTKRLKIGQLVLGNLYRNPALLAKMVSTMDVISNGRVELGIGAGWVEDEYIAYGYEYPSALDYTYHEKNFSLLSYAASASIILIP